jgi:hypothetical protein
VVTNLSPRFRGVKSVVRRRLSNDEGLTAKRILRRIEHKDKLAKQIGKKCVVR